MTGPEVFPWAPITSRDLVSLHNPVSALFRLERSRRPKDVRAVLENLVEWLRAPAQAGLRRDFAV